MITWHQLLNEGKERLIAAGYSDQTALLFLNELCKQEGINLYSQMEEPVIGRVQTDYLEGLHRLELQEPLSYILGYENFYGYNFVVNENVLIPRPETEELVSLVLQLSDEVFGDMEHIRVFDVATGSGAIGVTLSLEEPKMDVFCSDISQEALIVAQDNNVQLGGRAVFILGNMLDPFIDKNLECDILVCNPPYIPQDEEMESSVVDYEPHVALFGGSDGLKFYRRVLKKAKQVLNPERSILAFEMGWNQGERLKELAKMYFPDARIEIHQDLYGKDRMLSIVNLPKEEQKAEL